MSLQESKPTDIIEQFELPSIERKHIASSLIDGVVNGDIDPLDSVVWLQNMAKIVEQVKKNPKYKEAVLDALHQHSGRTTHKGVEIEQMESGVKYDFTSCGHPDLKKMKEYEDWCKDFKAYLKTIPEKGGAYIDEESGEVFDIFRPSKTSTTTYKVTLR